jgi:23S rRNA (cytosine1962-C5)-methyltransferase
VLNLFAYTCTFSVVALAAGASHVVNVDLSSRSLAVGRENHRINNQALSNVNFLALDILKSWGKLKKMGPYDIVIVDPPSFQKGSFIATKDYQKVIRRLPELLTVGGQVLAALNAPELGMNYLKALFNEYAPELQVASTLGPSSDFPEAHVGQHLKLLTFRRT